MLGSPIRLQNALDLLPNRDLDQMSISVGLEKLSQTSTIML